MNLRCKILGCKIEDQSGTCWRCGTWVYDYPFVQREGAWLAPWYSFRWWITRNRLWFSRRCDVCEKRMFFSNESCCSEKCYDEWYPF